MKVSASLPHAILAELALNEIIGTTGGILTRETSSRLKEAGSDCIICIFTWVC